MRVSKLLQEQCCVQLPKWQSLDMNWVIGKPSQYWYCNGMSKGSGCFPGSQELKSPEQRVIWQTAEVNIYGPQVRNGNLPILTLKETQRFCYHSAGYAATQNRISEVMDNLDLLSAAVLSILNRTLEFLILAHIASTVGEWSYTSHLILLSDQFITGNWVAILLLS